MRTSVRTEILAGATTWLTMAYIVVVNPSILAASGIDPGAAFVATCLAAAIGSAAMGLFANLPLALAPGMGLNAYFTFVVVKGMGIPWQTALGAVFLSGILFLIVSLLRVREWLIVAIPTSLKLGIGAGIGLFLGLIGLKEMGVVVADPATLVTLGHLGTPSTLLSCLGFLLIAGLSARGIPGAILIGILAVAAIGVPLGLTHFHGIVAAPPSLAPTFLQLDIPGALRLGVPVVVLTFFLVDVLDNAGTLIANSGGTVGIAADTLTVGGAPPLTTPTLSAVNGVVEIAPSTNGGTLIFGGSGFSPSNFSINAPILRLGAANGVTNFDHVRSDIDNRSVNGDRLVRNQLPCLGTSRTKSHPIDNIIKTRLKQHQQIRASISLSALGLSEVAPELPFKHTVHPLNFLLFSQLETKVGRTRTRGSPVLARFAVELGLITNGSPGALKKEIRTLSPGQFCFWT
jgi:hypothetical protein